MGRTVEGPAHRLGCRGVMLKLRALKIRVQEQVQQRRAFVFPETALSGFGDLGEGWCSGKSGGFEVSALLWTQSRFRKQFLQREHGSGWCFRKAHALQQSGRAGRGVPDPHRLHGFGFTPERTCQQQDQS